MRRLVALLAAGFAVAACAQPITPEKRWTPATGGSAGSAGTPGSGGSSGTSSGGSSGSAGSSGSSSGGSAGTSSGGSAGTSSGGSAGTSSGGSAGTSSGGSAGTSSGGSAGTSGMDPGLVLPNPNGTPCTHYGTSIGCSSLEVCRIYDQNSGRCETCDNCGNLNAYCVTDRDCDILFQCYQHSCTNFCQLGTSECGAVADCLDVGNATYGVCKP